MTTIPTVKLNNGYEMPAFGLGTYASRGDECTEIVKKAIDEGYRHFDTAYLYGNESGVGKGIREKIADGTIKRSDVFVTTKLWCTFFDPERVEYAFRKSFNNLDLEYIDLYLMHFPVSLAYHGDDEAWPKNPDGTQETTDIDYLDTYKAMEKLVDEGLVKSLGVSNFNSEQVARVCNEARIKPVCNQVECSPLLNQKKLTAFCKELDVVIVGFSPLAQTDPNKKTHPFLERAELKAIADRHNKTPAQVVFTYLAQLGVVPIPKTANAKRLAENIDIFDFALNQVELDILDAMNTGERIVKMSDAKHAKHWPYKLEY